MDYQFGPGPLQVDQNTIDEKIKGDIGIVENGDVATHALPSGYYVIWKGDLYVAKTDISSGTTLSSASNGNLTAKTQGIGADVAALNSNMRTEWIVRDVTPENALPVPAGSNAYLTMSAAYNGYTPIGIIGINAQTNGTSQNWLILWSYLIANNNVSLAYKNMNTTDAAVFPVVKVLYQKT